MLIAADSIPTGHDIVKNTHSLCKTYLRNILLQNFFASGAHAESVAAGSHHISCAAAVPPIQLFPLWTGYSLPSVKSAPYYLLSVWLPVSVSRPLSWQQSTRISLLLLFVPCIASPGKIWIKRLLHFYRAPLWLWTYSSLLSKHRKRTSTHCRWCFNMYVILSRTFRLQSCIQPPSRPDWLYFFFKRRFYASVSFFGSVNT